MWVQLVAAGHHNEGNQTVEGDMVSKKEGAIPANGGGRKAWDAEDVLTDELMKGTGEMTEALEEEEFFPQASPRFSGD